MKYEIIPNRDRMRKLYKQFLRDTKQERNGQKLSYADFVKGYQITVDKHNAKVYEEKNKSAS